MNGEPAVSRRYSIDWLRVIAVLTIFLFHTGRFFTDEDWSVHIPGGHGVVDLLLSLVGSWGMPFLFVISGASTWYALGKRRAGAFLLDRTQRLLVPLIVGIFTHAALQVYLERLTHGDFAGSFWQFYPHYFDGWYAFGGNFAWMGLHLWYLELLFLLSLIFYPLFAWLKRGSGRRLLAGLNRLLARPGLIYLPALLAAAALANTNPDTPWGAGEFGGWSIVSHMWFFFFGFVLASDEGVQESAERLRWVSLGAGVLLMAAWVALVQQPGEAAFRTSLYVITMGVAVFNAWCWILTLWGFARRRLSAGRPLLWYANEAVLPFYILHQTVLLCVGFFVLHWPLPDIVRWLIITPVSFGLICAIYWYLVRPFNVMRFLFGMKSRPRTAAAPISPARPQPA